MTDWQGVSLWLRRQRVPSALLASVIGLLLVNGGFMAMNSAGRCVGPECRANQSYWGPVMAVSCLGLILSPESALERVATRAAGYRRLLLALLVVVLGAFVCCAPLISDPAVFGAWAAVRNVVGFTGLLLLGHGLLERRVAWVPFVLVVLMTAFYGWSGHPSRAETVWGFPRQLGGLHTPSGEVDLSWPTAIALLCSGLVTYVRVEDSAGGARPRAISDGSNVLVGHGMRRQAGLVWTVGLLGIGGSMILLSRAAGWVGSLEMLTGRAVTGEWLAMVPTSVAIGVWMGQSRHRSGTAQFDPLGRRGRVAVWWSAAQHVVVAILGGQSLILLVTVSASFLVNWRDGISVSQTWSTHGGHSWPLVTYYGILVGLGLLASVAGYMVANRWFTPALTLVVYAAQFGLMPTGLFIADQEAPTVRVADYTACSGQRPVVCTRPPDAAYLPAAETIVREVYRRSPVATDLPGRVLVTDTVGFVDQPAVLVGPKAPDVALIGLKGHRTLSREKQLNDFAVQSDLRTSLGLSCSLSMDQRMALPPLDDPSIDLQWAHRYLTAVRECDTAALDALVR